MGQVRAWAGLWLFMVVACAAAGDVVEKKDVRRFPPDPQVNYKHLKLEIHMERPESKSFQAVETLTFAVPQRAIRSIELDAMELRIGRVTDLNGKELSYRHDGEKLLVRFEKELAPGSESGFRVEYQVKEPKRGMIFALPDEAYKDRPLIIHTQGQTDTNRYWFVGHDSPNARFTSETIVTVPKRFTVVGNGKLVSKKSAGDGLVEWHHSMDKPHVAYLLSLVIGEMDAVVEQWRGKPVEYFVPAGTKEPVQKIFGKTPKMLDLYSDLLGKEYPYAKYSQTVVPLFNWGGMENISATTLADFVLMDERMLLDHDMEDLIAHELAHQWFGDMVTCKSWPHIWLNEGFATYMEHVWWEHSLGADEFLHRVWELTGNVAEQDSVEMTGGVVHPFWEDAMDLFERPGSNPYTKGASVLHLLRRELGDDLFWASVREFLKRHEWKTVETDDFRKVVEDLSGRSFEKFFHQWLYRPGSPHIRVSYAWDDASKEARVSLEQTQKVSKESPPFDMNVSVWLVQKGGEISKHVVEMKERRGEVVVKVDKEPLQVCVDPLIGVLAKWEMNLPEGMLQKSLEEGPTLGARLRATAALKQKDSPAVRETMQGILLDANADSRLRREVANTLGTMQNEGARNVLLVALDEPIRITDHKVRAAAVSALGKYRHPRAAEVLLRYAKKDPTYTVEGLAAAGLGKQARTEEIVQVLMDNARRPDGSRWNTGVILGALAELDEVRGVDPAMAAAAYGRKPFEREPAIRVLGKLGRHEAARNRVRLFLVGMIEDTQPQIGEAVFAALGELGDEKAIPALEVFAQGSGPREKRQAARKAIDEINKKAGEPAVVKDLRERVEKMEKQLEQMKAK